MTVRMLQFENNPTISPTPWETTNNYYFDEKEQRKRWKKQKLKSIIYVHSGLCCEVWSILWVEGVVGQGISVGVEGCLEQRFNWERCAQSTFKPEYHLFIFNLFLRFRL